MSGHSYSLQDLASEVNGRLVGEPTTEIYSISTIQNASSGCISFLANPKYKKFLSDTQASAVIISPDNESDLRGSGIIVDDPYAAYAVISSLFVIFKNPYEDMVKSFTVHESSIIDDSAILGPNVYIGPNCIIGANSIIHANCSLVMNVEIGKNSIIHPNSVLGSDGFGYVNDNDNHENHTRRSETAGHLECLETFHKLKLLQMKFLIGKKHATPDFRGDVKS